MADDNVMRIHPAPIILNPLTAPTPWESMSDEQIAWGIVAARVRIDAAEHTIRSLEREQIRRRSVPTSLDSGASS